MRPHASCHVLAALALALLAPRTAGARIQGTPECPVPIPAPAPSTSYSCHFAAMPLYSQTDPNLAFVSVPCATYQSEIDDGTQVGTPHTCGSPGTVQPYAQSWLPGGPWPGDFGALPDPEPFSVICSSTAEAMAMNAALAYRSSSTAFTGEFCSTSSQCAGGYACVSGACVASTCSSTIHCPTGSTCQSGSCVVAACSGSASCPSGYDCQAGTCIADRHTVYPPGAKVPPPIGAPATFYTFGFNQGQHDSWAWDCKSYASQSAAFAALPRGFVGGCMGGAPEALWPNSTYPGAPPSTVFGLEQTVHMANLTEMSPTAGWVDIGDYDWSYYVSMEPFAAEFYSTSALNGSCESSAQCLGEYCVDSTGTLYTAPPGGPPGKCAAAAYQTLTPWDQVTGYSSSVAITTAGLRAAIDQGGTGVLSQHTWQVVISTTTTPSGPVESVTFAIQDSHFVALQGYDVSYDSSANETLSFTYNNPANGTQQSTKLVDISGGTYVSGTTTRVVTLPGETSSVVWPAAVDGSGRTVSSVWDLQNGEVIWMSGDVYYIYLG